MCTQVQVGKQLQVVNFNHMKIIKKQVEIKKLEEGQEVIETVEKEYISIPQPSTLIDKEEYVQNLHNKIEEKQNEITELEIELSKVQLLIDKK